MFEKAFETNFYDSEEFVSFCESVSGIHRNKFLFSHKNLSILKNKNVSIKIFPENEMNFMKQHKIHFLKPLLINNSTDNNPSMMEYTVWYYKPYDEAYFGFDKTFRKYSKRAEKLNFETKIIREYDVQILNQAYKLYVKQMRRLNGFIFPKYFFKKFMELKSSFLLAIYDNDKLVGYSFCFENSENMYTSIGGGDKKYFSKYINYKLYNEKIKYACEHKLNIHMGMGTNESGFNDFKRRVGAISLKVFQYPNDEEFLRKVLPLLKYKIAGIIFEILSRLFPKKIVFFLMPFT